MWAATFPITSTVSCCSIDRLRSPRQAHPGHVRRRGPECVSGRCAGRAADQHPTVTATLCIRLHPHPPQPTHIDRDVNANSNNRDGAHGSAPECDNPLPPAGSPWDSADVGTASPVPAITGAGGGDAVYICGTGGAIWGSTDTFRYAYQVVSSSNVEIIARLREWGASPAAGDYAQTGVMIRNSTSPGSSARVFGDQRIDGTSKMDWCPSDGSNTQETSDGEDVVVVVQGGQDWQHHQHLPFRRRQQLDPGGLCKMSPWASTYLCGALPSRPTTPITMPTPSDDSNHNNTSITAPMPIATGHRAGRPGEHRLCTISKAAVGMAAAAGPAATVIQALPTLPPVAARHDGSFHLDCAATMPSSLARSICPA